MSKNTLLSAVLGAALLTFAACSNEREEVTPQNTNTELIDVAKMLKFNVSFESNNTAAPTPQSRAAGAENVVEQQTVELGDGLFADYSLEEVDAVEPEAAATRAVGDGAYTMLVYDTASKEYKGELKGTLTNKLFEPAPSSSVLLLAPGTYDFVLYNDKFTRSGNELTVKRADVAAAYYGRTTKTLVTATQKQSVAFALKRYAARVNVMVNTLSPATGLKAELQSVDNSGIPGSAIYNAADNTWKNGAAEALSVALNFGNSTLENGSYNAKNDVWTMLVPGTDTKKLKLAFTAGKVDGVELNGKWFTFANSSVVDPNKSYRLVVNVRFGAYLYLLTDGTTGGVNQTKQGGAGSKYAIGVVIDSKYGIAVALDNAKEQDNEMITWCSGTYSVNIHNVWAVNDLDQGLTNQGLWKSGFRETWDMGYSIAPVKVKAQEKNYHAFKCAGEYRPNVRAKLHDNIKFFLPSYSDWKAAYARLGFGNFNQVKRANVGYSWSGTLANRAFTQVHGKAITGKTYWSSTEQDKTKAGVVIINADMMRWNSQQKTVRGYVRPFIKYPVRRN